MFEYEIDKIRSILIDVLGQPKNEPYSSGWQSFCCPYCAANEGVESDGKYNLETNAIFTVGNAKQVENYQN